ncbi:MAG: thiamine pyrophosphate-dependent dehydrogenase E1 component subunit alpha [Proteobacteria bacterium]|nr:thiamine pyrophosphate-dependent dehydrogenase E1 component subunit alpha [Pseudomonadota bacterium]
MPIKHKKVTTIFQPTFTTSSDLHIPVLKILQEDGSLYPESNQSRLRKKEAIKIYDAMLFIRALDERMLSAQRQGRVSFYMTSTGEEASHIGAGAALKDDDMIIAQYREPGPLYYRGFTAQQFADQLFSNEHDLGKGRQMPIHYGSKALNYLTISSPLATQIPQATGYAYAQKYEKKDHCTLCFFGEGAASEGDFHAALNMATVFKVPVIFFCRNNGYAISTPSTQQFAADGIAPRGLGYGMKTMRIDGNDILAVYEATKEARKEVITKSNPVLIEAMTYRLGAHSTSDDPSSYRSKKEENLWSQKDPVLRTKNWLISNNWWSEKRDKELQKSKREEVINAIKSAETMKTPPLTELITDVYDQAPWNLEEQYKEIKDHVNKYPEQYPNTARRS